MDFSKIDEGHTDGEEKLVFYYNREERLKRAPSIVQRYYRKEGEFGMKRGLFRSLVATKANRIMLVTLGFLFAVVLFIGLFAKYEEGSLLGVGTALSAFSFEDTVYVSIKLDKPGKNFDQSIPLPVKANLSFFNIDEQLLEKQELTGKYEGNEVFLRTTIRDYDIIKVIAIVEMADASAELKAQVQKR